MKSLCELCGWKKMELDFDKEIDAMLRNARRNGPVYVGDSAASRHLDADEISAFAENAMPEKGRALYTAHLADCDRCRKILSNLLMMNAEGATAASLPGAITIAERDLPWYRKLFLFPNLAYLMGSLVLVFGGFLAFSIIQNSRMGDSAVVTQVSESETRSGGPSFESEPAFSDQYSTNSSANAAANVASPNSMTLAANANRSATSGVTGERGPQAETAMRDDRGVSLDGTAVTTAPAPPAAALAAPKDADAKERDEQAKGKTEDKLAGNVPQEAFKNDAMLQKQPAVGAQSGPMRSNENQYNRQLENLDRRAAAKRAARSEEESSGRRVVGGRTFERKQSVWYDTAYQGRPTINVRRGSEEFSRLDAGLRSIANNLPGTIVVVWGAKAYRIQ